MKRKGNLITKALIDALAKAPVRKMNDELCWLWEWKEETNRKAKTAAKKRKGTE